MESSGEYVSTVEKLGAWRSNQESQLRGLLQTINSHHEFTIKIKEQSTATASSMSELQERDVTQSRQIEELGSKFQRQPLEDETLTRLKQRIKVVEMRPPDHETQLRGLSQTIHSHSQFTVEIQNTVSSIKARIARQSDRIEKFESELQSQRLKAENHARLHDKSIKALELKCGNQFVQMKKRIEALEERNENKVLFGFMLELHRSSGERCVRCRDRQSID